jgi:hypothetical protein
MKNIDTLNGLLAKVSNLDHYTKASIVGALAFMANMSAINAAMRYAPPLLEDGEAPDLDKRNAYDYMRADMYKNDLNAETIGMWSNLVALLADYADGYDIEISGADRVLEFLVARPPQRKMFIAEYETRRKQGCKPQMSVKDFVDGQYAEALVKHEKLAAYGADAIRLVNTTPPRDVDIPDWYCERAEEKCADKCNDRWLKIATRASNPKLKKAQRDEAEMDLKLIRAFMDELGYEIYADGGNETDEDIDHFLEEAGKLDDVLPTESKRKLTTVKKAA